MEKDLGTKYSASNEYKNSTVSLSHELRNSPIPANELTGNLGLYIERMHLSRIFLMHELYKQVVNIPGNIMEFGVRWGQNMVLLAIQEVIVTRNIALRRDCNNPYVSWFI